MNASQQTKANAMYALLLADKQKHAQNVEFLDKSKMPTNTGIADGQITALKTGSGQPGAPKSDWDEHVRLEAANAMTQMANMTHADPMDDTYQLVKKYVAPGTDVVPGIGKVWLQPEFWDYAARKRDEELRSQFEVFKMNQVDVKNPAARAYWEKKDPEMLEKIRQGYEDKMATQARMARIELYGVQSEDDMMFMFLQSEDGNMPQIYPQSSSAPVAENQSWFDSLKGIFIPAGNNGEYGFNPQTGARTYANDFYFNQHQQ